MILCFSGTGNSRLMADALSALLGDEVMRMAPGEMINPSRANLRSENGRIVWVFPVHGWGLPYTVRKVIENIGSVGNEPLIHHMVCTCGDDIGYADRLWRRAIQARGWKSGAAFSVQMPNNYTFMKGFDVDSPELAQAKLDAMPARLQRVAQAIDSQEHVTDVVRGAWGWAKTYILGPLFRQFMTSPKPFHVTEECMSCGKCARNCPLVNISMTEGKPAWGMECTMCSRCYHCCPSHAVAYGRATQGKGQYLCPGFVLK